MGATICPARNSTFVRAPNCSRSKVISLAQPPLSLSPARDSVKVGGCGSVKSDSISALKSCSGKTTVTSPAGIAFSSRGRAALVVGLACALWQNAAHKNSAQIARVVCLLKFMSLSQSAADNVVQSDQTDACAPFVHDRQDGDLRRAVFHHAQCLVGERVGRRGDGRAQHD